MTTPGHCSRIETYYELNNKSTMRCVPCFQKTRKPNVQYIRKVIYTLEVHPQIMIQCNNCKKLCKPRIKEMKNLDEMTPLIALNRLPTFKEKITVTTEEKTEFPNLLLLNTTPINKIEEDVSRLDVGKLPTKQEEEKILNAFLIKYAPKEEITPQNSTKN